MTGQTNIRKMLISGPACCFYGLALLLLALTFDIGGCHSRYLYFSTELGLLLFSAFLYLLVFKGRRWNEPFEPEDDVPRRGWRRHAGAFLVYLTLCAVLLAAVWFGMSKVSSESAQHWLRSGMWYLYFFFIFGVVVILTLRHMEHINFRALIASVIILDITLTAYEVILLSQGTGWRYNRTVIGLVFGIPVDNILFVYPIAPALCMVVYSIVTRRLNDLKAFWASMAILIPGSVAVELIGIYPLDLWQVFNDKSVWPMGATNFEEFFYYILFQALAVLLYMWFDLNLRRVKRPAPR